MAELERSKTAIHSSQLTKSDQFNPATPYDAKITGNWFDKDLACVHVERKRRDRACRGRAQNRRKLVIMTLNCDLKHISEGHPELVPSFFSTSLSHSENPLSTHVADEQLHLEPSAKVILAELPLPSSHTLHQISVVSDSPKNRSDKTSKHPGAFCCTTTLRDRV